MDVQAAGTRIQITLAGDEAFDPLQYLRHDGVYRRTAEALLDQLWQMIGPPASGAAMERVSKEG
jgi:hypothetical protein